MFNRYFDSYLFQYLTIANIERVVNQQECNKKGYQNIFKVLQNWLDSEFYHFCRENGLRQYLLIIVFSFNLLSDLILSQWTIMIISWIFIEISQGQAECYIIDPCCKLTFWGFLKITFWNLFIPIPGFQKGLSVG